MTTLTDELYGSIINTEAFCDAFDVYCFERHNDVSLSDRSAYHCTLWHRTTTHFGISDEMLTTICAKQWDDIKTA